MKRRSFHARPAPGYRLPPVPEIPEELNEAVYTLACCALLYRSCFYAALRGLTLTDLQQGKGIRLDIATAVLDRWAEEYDIDDEFEAEMLGLASAPPEPPPTVS